MYPGSAGPSRSRAGTVRAFPGDVVHSGGMSEHDLSTDRLPTGGRHDLVLVDGRSFVISAEAGDMVAATHGLGYDDLRHVSRMQLTVAGGVVELLGASTPTPLSAVIVSRVVTQVDDGPDAGHDPGDLADVLLVRRRWLGGGLVEELSLRNPHPRSVSVHVELEVAADFAHVFDVKSGTATGGRASVEVDAEGGWALCSPDDAEDSTRVAMQ